MNNAYKNTFQILTSLHDILAILAHSKLLCSLCPHANFRKCRQKEKRMYIVQKKRRMTRYIHFNVLNPIRSRLFQTANDPGGGGGGFKSPPPLRSRKLLCQSSPYQKQVLLTLYNTLVLPYFNYCILSWGSKIKENHQLYLLQKKAVRIITHSNYVAHTEPLCKQYGIIKLTDMFSLAIWKFYYKLMNN